MRRLVVFCTVYTMVGRGLHEPHQRWESPSGIDGGPGTMLKGLDIEGDRLSGSECTPPRLAANLRLIVCRISWACLIDVFFFLGFSTRCIKGIRLCAVHEHRTRESVCGSLVPVYTDPSPCIAWRFCHRRVLQGLGDGRPA